MRHWASFQPEQASAFSLTTIGGADNPLTQGCISYWPPRSPMWPGRGWS
jgi:hypothetical protein